MHGPRRLTWKTATAVTFADKHTVKTETFLWTQGCYLGSATLTYQTVHGAELPNMNVEELRSRQFISDMDLEYRVKLGILRRLWGLEQELWGPGQDKGKKNPMFSP